MKLTREKKLPLVALIFCLVAAGFCIKVATAGTGQIQLLNDRSREIVGADLLNAPGFITPEGLTGKGQVVAVADSGIDKGSPDDIHPDLASEPGKKPKIIMLKSWAGRKLADDPVGHGTHMVGTIAGSGKASGGQFGGLAPDASIYFQGILNEKGEVAPPENIDNLFLPAYQAGARIHVDAWGGGSDAYGSGALDADAFIRQHPDFLVIFGAGNAGPEAKTITSEANSKNALVVGASSSPRPSLDFSTDGTLSTAGFSSRGPAGDGRLKPDLLAPGTSIISTKSSLIKGNLPGYPEYTRMQGTSMAAAVAAGSTALLREYMQREMAIPDPMAASLKAILINGARTGGAGPSSEGFGVLDLAGAVLALKEKTMLLDENTAGLPQDGVKTYKIKVQYSDEPFKATLAWTDPAGDPSAGSTLVNNLDLTVTAPDGKKYLGNAFLGRAPDAVNNVEQVYINNPIPGDYLVNVTARTVRFNAVAGGSYPLQDYSLVFGQPLNTGIIKEAGTGGALSLYGGQSINTAGREMHYILNGRSVRDLKPSDGFRVYYSASAVYVAGRQWSPESATSRETPGGRLWYEADGDSGEGGYYQSPQEKGVMVNGILKDDVANLPPGVRVNADVDGVTQTLWKVVIGYGTVKGNVDRTVEDGSGKITAIYLYGDSGEFRVSSGASYIYNDTFEGADPIEKVFGAGELDGLHGLMPGQQVTLVFSPSLGTVNSILVDRTIVSGYVTGIAPGDSQITIDSNPPFQVFSGAGIERDRAPSSLSEIVPGDYVMAITLPGTGQIMGMEVYSNVSYGQVLFSSDRDKSLYMNDFRNIFSVYGLTGQTEVWRWGLRSDVSTLSSGTWIRVILSPDRKKIWRIDVAELLEDEQKQVQSVGSGQIKTTDGEMYGISDTVTAITREGLPVPLEDLRPGDKITIASLLAPAPDKRVPVSIKARNPEAAKKPLFMAAVLEQNGQLVLSGYTSGDMLYIWHEDGTREDIPVKKGVGSFERQLKFINNEGTVKVVTIDSESGAVAGKTFIRSEITRKQFVDINGHWAEKMILSSASSGIMAGYGDGTFRPDRPVTLGELAVIWSGVTGSKGEILDTNPSQTITRAKFLVDLQKMVRDRDGGGQDANIPFTDCDGIAAEERKAISWAYARGIIRGESPQLFEPEALLTRAEAAVMLQLTLQSFSGK